MLRLNKNLLLLLLIATPAVAQEQKSGTLFWANGDILPGELLETEGDKLRWKSPLFREPLEVKTSVLSAVRFAHNNEIVQTDEAFRLITRSGNVIHGALEEITDEVLKLTSKRHGMMAVDRTQIRSLRRLDNPALIYLGPTGSAGWTTTDSRRKITDWETTDEGWLTTRRDKAQLFRGLEIPGRAEIEIVLSSTDQLQFNLGLNEDLESDIHLETWDDVLVALYDEEFVEIETITQGKRDITLRIYWDEEAKKLTVYSEAGAELGSIDGGEKGKSSGKPGIQLINQGSNLTLKSLRVSRWDGSKPKALQKGQNRVHLIDGSILYGTISALESGTIRLVKEDDEEENISLEKIDSVYLADDLKTIPNGSTNVFWLDGTRLTGELAAIGDGRISLTTNYSSDPVVSTLDNSNRLLFTPAKPSDVKSEAAPDRLPMFYGQGCDSKKSGLVVDL